MTASPPATPARHGRSATVPMPLGTLAAFAVAVLAVLLIAYFSWKTLQIRTQTAQRITRTLQVMEQFPALLSTLKDAETGQRGFLLTGLEQYLDPYNAAKMAIATELRRLRQRSGDNPAQQARIDQLEALTADKLAELAETVTLQRAGRASDALVLVQSDRGRIAMDRIRTLVAEMQDEESQALARHQAEWEHALFFSDLVTWGGTGILLLLISASAGFTVRDFRSRETEAWLRATQLGLSQQLQGSQQLGQISDKALRYLAARLDAQVAAAYVDDDEGQGYRRVAGYALPPGTPERLKPGEGLPGQAVKENRTLIVRELPQDYWPVASGVGSGKPREVLVVPVSIHGVAQAVLEFGFFRAVDAVDEELFRRIAETLGMAIRGAKDRTRLQTLLEETQSQAEELQVQQEELRVSNEELEEQGRSLRESKTQLETQQAELEQINADLELQTQLLEGQKAALSQAQTTLLEKSAELERSNRIKSEFLANMSHELRTPLNSSLILSKLLADNKHGNLTPEQVNFAQTIHGAGNDLLALINDILDLSKIEAGKMDVAAEPVFLAPTVDAMVKDFMPLAQQKGLALGAVVEPGAPQQIDTDPRRLAQILRNLLGNALKFTGSGEVALRVHADSADSVCFSVRDTGIGIAPENHGLVFEAFRQADGGTHRKFGGTGLGLSISRDLARLLGGDIALHSAPGQGSVFTLTLPRAPAQRPAPDDSAAPRRQPPPPSPLGAAAAVAPAAAAPGMPPRHAQVEDDRDRLAGASRVILVIEDDTRFATILRDLVREKGFCCVVAQRAADGIDAALALRPSAIVLDMNLPDYSGLVVLDQLKRDAATRHIPVHVVSVADYSVAAMERGAVGYALKPVQREQLLAALETLEAKFSQGLRRVLVVEDDARQMQSIKELLSSDEVEIVGVASAEQALAQLDASRFDCMVMDLNLPGASGHQLLEDMARRGGAPAPPVIVYTGRSLSRDEEQRLRRHSNSIIIKDARSPERLLGEVTLFLHQVEAKLPADHQRMLSTARARDARLEGRRILVVEDDVRNIFALSSVLEPHGAHVAIARNGLEALQALGRAGKGGEPAIDLVLMDIMMPEMDGFTAIREIRKDAQWRKLPIIALTAKAMKDDQEQCLAAGANDYIAKPLDVEKLLSLVRVWMPR
jgi:signal transduction histidine kinase/DNA-binding response OmpR family regulator/CHASE3 domain sensor protein